MNADSRCASPLGWHLLQCTHGSRVWLPQRCRRCTGCHNARRNRVLARLSHALDGAPNSAMLTLTTVPGTSWPTIMRAFQHLVRTIRKVSPELQYAACKEEGSENGMKHLHVILTNFLYMPQSAIAIRWRKLTGAHIVRIERLRSDRAGYYVAKYVSKDLTAARKHVTFSKGFPPLPEREERFTHLTELPPFGPTNVAVWTDNPGIVQLMVDECQCFGDTHSATIAEHLWLKSLLAPSSHLYPVGSGP